MKNMWKWFSRKTGFGHVAGAKLRVNVDIEARRADGTVFARRECRNMMVTTGESYLAGLLSGGVASTGAMKAVGIGTGTTAEATTQTALVTEVETRQNGTQSLVTTTHTNDTYQCVSASITATSARAVTEAGLFNSTTVGGSIMLARALFSVINMAINDTLAITWKVPVVGS